MAEELRIYSILRGDLNMSTGKACSQAGHAVLSTFLLAPKERQDAYQIGNDIGTKICLVARNQQELEKFAAWAQSAGLPHALITDTGRNTTFGGVPTVSALGIGPITKAEAKPLRKLQLCV